MPERFSRSLGRPRREQTLPLGQLQHSLCQAFSTSGRCLGLRICLRRGCHRVYRARRWNQRYCQHPECRKLVRRWQAAKRQQQRRQQPEVRQAHAAAERERRARRRAASVRQSLPVSEEGALPEEKQDEGREAWSRSKGSPAFFCDRPGCYDAVRESCRCQARYCSDGCRQALRRVRDRERKWLNRHTQGARSPRPPEYPAGRAARRARSPTANAGEGRSRASDRAVGRQL
jgi:hypothetical protein